MKWIRALLRQGLVGCVLAYVLAAQTMLAGPALAATVSSQHELCLSGESAPDQTTHHEWGACCIAACAVQKIVLEAVPLAVPLAMRQAVPILYAVPSLPFSAAHGPDRPSARGPPSLLV
jgi:hypothetical protein